MEDVLDLYAEAPSRKRPVVCFDESPVQLSQIAKCAPSRSRGLRRDDRWTGFGAQGNLQAAV